ncbi:MAG TPA: hypothetical protein VL202_24830 [Pararhizobium sp.]|uniref:hypothetical protein n=1 Tax=Pararhizobium sp. TaxID=1977563 RepID=UPI002BA02AF7|nr:hypothetical protein [Pararhizobium sp.]HTO34367.1 hypothetical protein [Pararhizobium sp.]
MSYDNTAKPSSSLGGMVLLLLFIMIGISATIVSTGMIGTPERQAKVFVPINIDTLAAKK